MIYKWLNVFIKPSETFEKEKANASFGGAIINFAVAGIISVVINFAVEMVFGSGSLGTGGNAAAAIGVLIIILLNAGLMFVLSKLLGGNGSYVQLFFLISLFTPVVSLSSGIPIFSIIVGLYGLVLTFKAVKISQNLSTFRSIAVVLISIIIITGMITLVMTIFLANIYPAIAAPSAKSPDDTTWAYDLYSANALCNQKGAINSTECEGQTVIVSEKEYSCRGIFPHCNAEIKK